ncbi:DMT family transporter [Sulfitobacter mediterraneus]|uniref:DMT family transporter n=1 Tax=Sulfitobacter mediterraneus TaxID=83219 RepID=UPI001939E7BE|nr:DMT family transporter [Sulfitobacter mediterraneus]MBM1556593.1 DMT family transporter [Sulfitobacter mediterraneus]MBM1569699.1 DMT family transporter [Sulfitobacter mediterraneus]MBM1573656.1 DMT family transporter [Sulfitobacter mediterraneus]MBM1577445.1 DMT family transporter [Sulfitobacter mediterraneus]MBM1579551.1 DMT family transporter [Sulfitobacter mediterraneus]
MSTNSQAILWALLAAALFSAVIALAKVAVVDYHVLQILLFRQIFVFMSSVPDILKAFPQSLKTRQPGLHALRLIGAFVALSTGIWAVAVLPLTTATTLTFAQVFFVAVLAAWFLIEPVGVHRLGAVLVGFIGVIVVMRPGVDGLIDLNSLIPVIGAFGAAVAVIAVRRLTQTETTATLLVYQSVFIGAAAALPMFWYWKTPDLAGLALLVSMGVLATAGQWIGVRALRLGEASVVGNIEYSKLIYAALLGWVIFEEVPDKYTIFGAAIIISSSLYIYHREAS